MHAAEAVSSPHKPLSQHTGERIFTHKGPLSAVPFVVLVRASLL